MATGTAKPGSPSPQPARGSRRNGRVVEYQQYIDTQLGRTRRRVQWVDLWTALTTLFVGFVAYLLLAAVIDHWIVPGGLGTAGRWLLLVGLLGGIAAHFVGRVLPVFVRRVNPVYAAAAIEQGGRMKNTLINFLMLRRQPEAIPDGVLEAMKEQAALRLSNVPEDAPVDRTSLIRWFYVLAAILVAAVTYAFLSPKDAFTSVRRVISPWADVAAPTRVRFDGVEPGNVDKRRDEVVEVVVRVAGLRSSDNVVLHYSATGRAVDDVALPMQSDERRYLWKAVLPPGSEGLKQDLYYRVQAGDADTEQYRIRVLTTPVINVRTVQYDYPAYTGLPPRTVEKQGDLSALEGTRVTLVAETNQNIRSAHVAFDQARNKDVELQPDGLQATGNFVLSLTKDRSKPLHSTYVLRFTNVDGEENPKPIEHHIDVTADQSPEVQIVEPNSPPEKELLLPLGQLMKVTAAGRDPDFQLADLAIVFESVSGRMLREEHLLAEPKYGDVSGTLLFGAEKLNVKVGERFKFYARATDNKSPQPNVVQSPRYTVLVTPGNGEQRNDPQQRDNPQGQPPPDQQNQQRPNDGNQGNPQPNDQRNPPQNGDGQPAPNDANRNPPEPQQEGKPGDGQPGDGSQPGDPKNQPPQGNDGQPPKGQPAGNDADRKPGESGERGQDEPPREPIDPNVNPGEAIEAVNEYFDRKDRENQPQPNPADQQQPNDNRPQPNENRPQNDPMNGSNDAPQPKPQDGARDQKNADQKPGESPQQDGPPQQPDAKQNGDQQAGDQKNGGSGEQPQPNGGQQPGGDQKSGPPQNGAEPQPGDKPQTGDKQQPRDKQGEQPGADRKNNDKQTGDKQAGDGGQADQQTGGGQQPGDQKQTGGSEAGGGAKSGGADDQKGPQDGQGAEERQAGGDDRGVGRDNSAGGGNKDRQNEGAGGSPQNQPASQGDEKATKPGGEGGTDANQQPTDGAAPRKPGQNDGGREAERRPDAGDAPPDREGNNLKGEQKPVDPNDKTQQGSGEQNGGQPNKDPAGRQPGSNNAGERPEGSEPGAASRPNAQTNEGQPNVERNTNSSDSGSGAKAGGDESKPNEQGQRPGEEPNAGPQSKPSANDKQPAGNTKNPGGPDGPAPNNEGSPDQEKTAKPRDKTGGANSDNQLEPGESEKSPGSNSPHESNAEGQTSGDRSAKNGEEGAGQKSDQKGTGAAGQNTAGEQGGGTASDEGNQSTSDKPGDKVRSNDPSQGKPSEQVGEGTQTERGGDKAGGESRGTSNDAPPSGANGGTNQTGLGPGGNDGDRDPSPPPNADVTAPPPDQSNLDYSRQVTDLALDRLKQQLEKGEVDPELSKLFKSPEAIKQFVDKYDALRKAAREPGIAGEQAREKYQETLKTLGLRPGSISQDASRGNGDDFRDVRGAHRSEPPAKYADQFRAYRPSGAQSNE